MAAVIFPARRVDVPIQQKKRLAWRCTRMPGRSKAEPYMGKRVCPVKPPGSSSTSAEQRALCWLSWAVRSRSAKASSRMRDPVWQQVYNRALTKPRELNGLAV